MLDLWRSIFLNRNTSLELKVAGFGVGQSEEKECACMLSHSCVVEGEGNIEYKLVIIKS